MLSAASLPPLLHLASNSHHYIHSGILYDGHQQMLWTELSCVSPKFLG